MPPLHHALPTAAPRRRATSQPNRLVVAALGTLLLASALTMRASATPLARRVLPQLKAGQLVAANHVVRPLSVNGINGKVSDELARAINKQDFTALPNSVMRPHSARAEAAGLSAADATIVNAIVCFDHAPTASDVSALKAHGFHVPDVFSHAIYAVRILGPVAGGVQTLRDLAASVPGITAIEPDRTLKFTGITGTRQIGARQSWSAYQFHNATLPLSGDPERAIAVMDTGIDDTHPDLVGDGHKIAAYDDEYSGGTTPVDYYGHGSFVAGVAAGTGASGGLASGTGTLTITIVADALDAYFGFLLGDIPLNTTGNTSSATLTLSGYDPDFFADQTDTFGIADTATSTSASTLVSASGLDGSNTPLTVSTAIAPNTDEDLYAYFSGTQALDQNTVAMVVKAPQTAIGDGFNLMAGTAPQSQLVSVRVADSSDEIDEDAVLRGFDWVSQNMARYNIGVLNMSFGGGSDLPDPTMDTAVDSLTAQGVVCVAAAGNSRYDETAGNLPDAVITSPASATDAIAVAAVGNANQITDYSSYGGMYTVTTTNKDGTTTTSTVVQSKPDVAAPGGSYPAASAIEGVADVSAHDETITSVDDNFADNSGYVPIQDENANDYTDDVGTSFSAPHVAGAAALLEQALTLPGAFGGKTVSGGSEALTVKSLLEMTSTETNTVADADPQPTLDKGARDQEEGYGKINADAAIGAVLNTFLPGGTPLIESLGTTATTIQANAVAPQAYAANVSLIGGTSYTFTLAAQPDDAASTEYDLYLYSSGYSSDSSISDGAAGDPIILAESDTSASVAQTVTYTPKANEVDVVVVKRVAGSGAFSLSGSGYSTTNLAVTIKDATTGASIPYSEVVVTDTSTGTLYAQGPTTITPPMGTTAGYTDAFLTIPAAIGLTVSATAFGYYGGSASFPYTDFTIGTTTPAVSVTLAPSHAFASGLQMISVPMQYSGETIPQITLPQLDTAIVWSPADSAYVFSPNAPADTFEPGHAYWARLRQPTSINLEGTSIASPTYSIPLQVGWNMIGSPYANPNPLSSATISLSDGTVDTFAAAQAGSLVSNLYSYDTGGNAYDELGSSSALTAYTGYWIYSKQVCSLTLSGT